jgi:hypothetical protein
MRSLDILNIVTGTSTAPSYIEVGLDYTSIFHGKEYITGAGTRFPFYDTSHPADSTVLVATTFEITENPKFNGKYTVYTTPSLGGAVSSEYNSGTNRTLIRVNEVLPTDGTSTDLSSGKISHISTYLLTVFGEPDLVLLEQSLKADRPLDLVGRFSSGWGEIFLQNLLRQVQSFAGPNPPVNPFIGQLWYDSLDEVLMIRTASAWAVANSSVAGGAPYRAAIAAPGGGGPEYIWTVNHGLNLPAPFVCSADFFVDVGAGVHKMILPNDVTFSANSLTASFSQNYAGEVIVRA